MSTGQLRTLTQEERAARGNEAFRRARGQRDEPRPVPRRVAAPPTQRPASPDVLDGWGYVYDELRAAKTGRELGRRFGHDPYALARSKGVPVEHVPLGSLDDPKRPRVTILGRLANFPGHPLIQLVAGLNGAEDHQNLAHELAHFLGIEVEEHCDLFAKKFQEVADDELPGGRWRAIQDELLQRARRKAAADQGGLRGRR